MKKVYVHKENRRLKVGEVYRFYVLKCIEIPDDEKYFVLQDPFEEKHLLPAIYYKNYVIEEKQYLKCHVDKVNCKGQIFLEPIHPVYLKGECYEFKYIRKEKHLSKKGIEKIFYLFEGSDGYFAFIEANHRKNPPQKGAQKKFKVLKIKKSKIYLGKEC